MNQYEKREIAIDKSIADHADAYKAIIDQAEEEGRQPTEEDRVEITEHATAIETLKKEKVEVQANIATLKEVNDLSTSLGPQFSDFGRDVAVIEPSPAQVKSLGEQFIESKGYLGLMESGLSGQEFSSGPIELDTKATLTSTPGSVLQPVQYQPGIVETLYQRLYVADLCGSAATTASIVTYVSETTATNAAAATSEGAAKPESTLVFGETQDAVRKIATLLPVTDEMLEDAPQISDYVNQRLTLFIKQTEEAQLVSGSGTAPQIRGFLNRSGINTYARGTADDNATALFKAMNGTRGSAQLDVDAIVIHPNNWQAIRIAKDVSGQFYGGGPFYGPYGGPQGPAGASQFSADNLWGVRVVVTSAITANTALVGAFSTASAVFRRSGVTVEATNSHSTFFATNLTAIRAEERLALAVYRPGAFTQVTGLS